MTEDTTPQMDALERVEEAIGWDLDVKIEDGVMKITPADAGVALFGYVTFTQRDAQDFERQMDMAQDTIDELSDDNAKLRTLMEDVIEHLEGSKPELVEEILRVVYPIRATNTDGDTVRFEGENY